MVDYPDSASVISGGGYIGQLKIIPESAWEEVHIKRPQGNPRLKRLRALQNEFTIDSNYNLIEDFHNNLNTAIASEVAFVKATSSKDLWYKYLCMHSIELTCAYCVNGKVHSSYNGFLIHLRMTHAMAIEEAYKVCSKATDYDVYREAFQKINFKTHKGLKPRELSAKLAPNPPLVPFPLSPTEDTEINFYLNEANEEMLVSTCDNFNTYLDSPKLCAFTPLTGSDVTPPLTPEVGGSLGTINIKDIEKHGDREPTLANQINASENTTPTEYRNMHPKPSVDKMPQLKRSLELEAEVPTKAARKGKKIPKDTPVCEDSSSADSSSDSSDAVSSSSDEEPVKTTPPPTPPPKKKIKTKVMPKKSPKPKPKKQKKPPPKKPRKVTESTGFKVPKSTANPKKLSKDEDNTYWTQEFVANLENEAATAYESPEHANILGLIQKGINVEKEDRKAVKAETNKAWKQFNTNYCNVKTACNVRDNTAFLSNVTVLYDHYAKKTNKTNNPYKAEALVRQANNFLTFYNDQTGTESKKKVEQSMLDNCASAQNINTWKENVKLLSGCKTKVAFSKQIKTLLKSYNQKDEPVVPILKVLQEDLIITESVLGLQYKTTAKQTQPKLLKNLINQFAKGSLSNIRDLLDSCEASRYTDWFTEFKKYKTNISIGNNVKWFMNNLAQTLKGKNTPMNPFTKISKSDIEKIVKMFTEYLMCTSQERSSEEYLLFSAGFFQNLTIFCMKYIYKIYDKILKLYKLNPAKSQQPTDFHVGIFHDECSLTNKDDVCKQPKELKESYSQFMRNQTSKKKGNNIGFMGIDRIALCLFHMKLIASNLDIEQIADILPLLEAGEWKVFELIEAKCSSSVYNHLRSMLYEFLYNMMCNIIHKRLPDSQIFDKRITWDFYKNVLFNASDYQYPHIVLDVLKGFPTMVLNESGEPHLNNVVYDDSPQAWHVVAAKYKEVLFNELYPSYMEVEEPEEPMYPNPGVL